MCVSNDSRFSFNLKIFIKPTLSGLPSLCVEKLIDMVPHGFTGINLMWAVSDPMNNAKTQHHEDYHTKIM